MKEKYILTEEHRAQLQPWAEQWIANALRTEPQTDLDLEQMRIAMRGMYRAAGLDPPPREIFVPSPMAGAITSTIASVVWWLRGHPERHQELFGGTLTEENIVASARRACAIASSVMRGSYDDPRPRHIRRVAATHAATVSSTVAATHASTRAAK